MSRAPSRSSMRFGLPSRSFWMSIKIGTCWYARITCRWASVNLARAIKPESRAAPCGQVSCTEPVRGVLQCLNVNFLHLHHCAHDPLRAHGVFRHQFSQAGVVDLPGQSKTCPRSEEHT